MDGIITLLVFVAVTVGAVAIIVWFWSLMIQHKSVVRQKQAMDSQLDAIEHQKQYAAWAEERAKEGLDLSRKSVENQEKVIALLEQIRDRIAS